MNTISVPTGTQVASTAKPLWLVKLTRFEFWPYQVLYLPVFIYYIWLSIKARSITFFTAANPALHLGGLVGEHKFDILQQLPKGYAPTTILIKKGTTEEQVILQLEQTRISFPCVAKPNIGERGFAVEVLNNTVDLKHYINKYQHDFLIQPLVDLPVEAGVLCYRLPDGKTRISSIVIKSFLAVTGNGIDTLETLMLNNLRARFRLDYLLNKFTSTLQHIPAKGEQIVLEPIGNHCRGTTFLSGQHLINPTTEAAFDTLMQQIEGVYIGRFDVKAQSVQHLLRGEVTVLELNGVASEPAHIYDPSCSLREAYNALFFHYQMLFQIGTLNHKRGVKYASVQALFKTLWQHFSSNKA